MGTRIKISKSGAKALEKEMSDKILKEGMDIPCPACGKTYHWREGSSVCPECGNDLREITLELG